MSKEWIAEHDRHFGLTTSKEVRAVTELTRDIAFHARAASTLEGGEVAVERLTAPLLARIAELEAGLRSVGWNEVSGLCWCRESPEFTGSHEERCDRLRSLLTPAQEEPR